MFSEYFCSSNVALLLNNTLCIAVFVFALADGGAVPTAARSQIVFHVKSSLNSLLEQMLSPVFVDNFCHLLT